MATKTLTKKNPKFTAPANRGVSRPIATPGYRPVQLGRQYSVSIELSDLGETRTVEVLERRGLSAILADLASQYGTVTVIDFHRI